MIARTSITPRLRSGLLAALVWILPHTAPAESGFDAGDLVPAAFGIWTDRAGSSWSVEAGGNIGRIGSAMVNSGLVLLVDDQKFEAYRPMMREDGKELVMQGLPWDRLPGLEVQRRIRLLDEPGGLLYAELFYNGSTDPMTLSVGLDTNFSGNFKTFLTDRGRAEPLILGEAESSVIVLPGASQSSRAFLFTLAGTSGGTRPTISSQNRYGLTWRYRLDLAPGATGVIVHHVAQIAIPQELDRRALLRATRPYALLGLSEFFHPDWKSSIRNVLPPPDVSPRSLFRVSGVDALGAGAVSLDFLLLGNASRLPGRAEGGPVRLQSRHGEVEVPLDRLAAATGGRRVGALSDRLYLRDGQILSGDLGEGLAFVPSEGARLELVPQDLDRLVLKGATGLETWPESTAAFLETHGGDRLRLPAMEGFSLTFATAWGVLPLSLPELVWLRPAPGGVGLRVTLRDGTECDGFVQGSEFTCTTAEFGDLTLPASQIRQVVTEAGWKREPGAALNAEGTVVHLPAGQVLPGAVADSVLPFVAEGAELEVALAEVRRMTRDGVGRLRLERWDGGALVGTSPADALSFLVGERPWRVPLRDITSIEFAPPSLEKEELTKIEALVLNLASPDWATREAASRDLGAFGTLARPVLRRELAEATDPEVERRLERILAVLR